MKIGILGGTFDPIHRAHLAVARAACETFGLQRVLLMPTGNSYLKTTVGKPVTEARHRAQMVRLAAAGKTGLEFSSLELERPGYTYTSDTLRDLSERFPDVQWYFIVGADSLHGLTGWHEPEVILRLADLIVAGREEEVTEGQLQDDERELTARYGARIHRLDLPDMDISSSRIREEIAQGRLPHPDLTDEVNAYIGEHLLYLSPLEEEEILARLRGELKPARVVHTLGVAQTAVDLAVQYGTVAPGRARLAGLLHDCGKERGTALTHGSVGAGIARDEFGIRDEEILSAIRCHTTGKPAMTDLEKILFIADYIEPNRDRAPHLEELRAMAFQNMDETICCILEDTLAYLRDSGTVIDEQSLETYTYYDSLRQSQSALPR